MSIFDINMTCLKDRNPKLYQLLLEIDVNETSNRPEQVYSVNTVDGSKALVVRHHCEDYRLNSIYSPANEAKIWVKQYKFQSMENIISMFGLGSGEFAKAIVKRMGEKDTFLIFEPSYEVFLHVLHTYDLRGILDNKKVLISIEGVNSFDFHHNLMNYMNINNLRSQIMCVHPMYDIIFEDNCILYWKEMKDNYIHTKMNINTVIAFGERLIDNALKNVKFITNSNAIGELKEIIPKGMPAIVVSAGPSVRHQINYLKQAKGKAVIFAVDRILDYLLDEGVVPDFVATIDPKKPLRYFSTRTDVTIPLLCYLESNNEIFEAHKGRKIICHCSDFFSDIYVKYDIYPPRMLTGASVATLAFTACLVLDFEQIILVGQDLAYDGDLSHAGSINEGEIKGRDTMIEGIDGQMVRSRLDWKEFVVWFQDMIVLFPKVTVIDAKEKGAKIKGTINMSLKDALEKYCDPNVNQIIRVEDLKPTFTEEVYDDIREYLEQNISVLNKIEKKSKNAIKICNTLMKEAEKNLVSKKLEDNHKKLNNIINFILKQPIYRMMDLYITAKSAQDISEMYEFTENVQDNSIQTYKKSRHIFETMLQSVEYIKPKLEQSSEEFLKKE